MDAQQQENLKKLPQVHRLLESESAEALLSKHPQPLIADAIRERLGALRAHLLNGMTGPFDFDEPRFFSSVSTEIEAAANRRLRWVINATGIVIHTNLGRVPLAPEAVEAIQEIALGYSSLEMNLETGRRGSRYAHVEPLICAITGAESALVVNNNAAAVLLALDTFARGGEVIVSRGELIEIGGSFRLPDVIASSGATLIETGSTNKTRAADYEDAITDDTRLLMSAHPSNYRIVGFTETVSRTALVELGRKRTIPVLEDLGSGALIDLTDINAPRETMVQESVSAGMDIVTFSGDKLLGGPQCGIIAGRREYIDRIKKNPMLRALRIDKLNLAALEATLLLYRNHPDEPERIPALRMIAASAMDVGVRARRLAAMFQDVESYSTTVVFGESYAGGGALPDNALDTRLLAVRSTSHTANELANALRENNPPIVARIADDQLLFDLRTVAEEEIAEIADALRRIAT